MFLINGRETFQTKKRRLMAFERIGNEALGWQ
jgi:hypothetical protein